MAEARVNGDGVQQGGGRVDSPPRAAIPGRLETRDLITIGVYSAVYGVVSIVAGIPFAFNPVLIYGLPVSVALFCAPVYLLLLAKVPKRGAVAILGAVVGLVLLVTGMYWLWSIATVVLGLVAGEITAAGGFRKPGLNTMSYLVFSLAPLGSYALIWINQSAFADYLISKGTDPAYIESMKALAAPWLLPALTAGILIAAWVGVTLGRRLLARHFRRAGIVA